MTLVTEGKLIQGLIPRAQTEVQFIKHNEQKLTTSTTQGGIQDYRERNQEGGIQGCQKVGKEIRTTAN